MKGDQYVGRSSQICDLVCDARLFWEDWDCVGHESMQDLWPRRAVTSVHKHRYLL